MNLIDAGNFWVVPLRREKFSSLNEDVGNCLETCGWGQHLMKGRNNLYPKHFQTPGHCPSILGTLQLCGQSKLPDMLLFIYFFKVTMVTPEEGIVWGIPICSILFMCHLGRIYPMRDLAFVLSNWEIIFRSLDTLIMCLCLSKGFVYQIV